MLKIIVKARINGGADGKLCFREQALYSLCHNMGAGMSDGAESIRVRSRQNIQAAVLIHNRS